jgi:lysophospholipase L1-like esterase
VAFGASNTFGVRDGVEPDDIYSARLESRLRLCYPGVSVINAGIRGNNTAHALERIERDVIDRRPDYCIVMFAINDSAIDDPAAGPRVAPERYSANLRQMVEVLRQRNIVPVLTTTTPLSPSTPRREREPYRSLGVNHGLEDYAQRIRQTASQMAVPLVDTYAAFLAAAGGTPDRLNRLLLADGMHMNPAGHDVVAAALANFFMSALAACSARQRRKQTS